MQYIINTGNVANDGTGEPLRTAFTQVNLNFDQVFNAGPVGSNIEIVNNSIITTNTNGNLILAPNGVGAVVVRSTLAPDLSNVRSIGTSTNRFNTVYTQYLNANTSTFTGNLYVNGNLNVTGNIVTVNYSNLTVSNTTITLASGASNGAQADGAGILVDGANANFTYSYESNSWTTNLPVTAPAFIGDGSQLTNVTANVDAANISGTTINPTVVYSNLTTFGSVDSISAVGDISTTGNVYANIVYGNTVVGILAGDGGNISNVRASAITGNVYYATFAGTAATANLAALATQSINADTALFALNANLAAFANNAVMSQRANSSGYSVQSDYANSAVVAGMAYELAPTANLSLIGNITVGGILTNNYYYANGTPFSGGAGSIIQSATPPLNPTASTLWWDEVSGRLYVYYNDGTSSQWVDAAPAGISGSGGGGGSIIQSDTAPLNPTPSTLWWNSVAGRLYVYYNDGTTSQWVDASPAGISGPGGGSGNTGNITFNSTTISTNLANTDISIYGNGTGGINIVTGPNSYTQLENDSYSNGSSYVYLADGNAYVETDNGFWTFDNTGNLVLSNGTVLSPSGNGVNQGLSITDVSGDTLTWGNKGVLTFPNGSGIDDNGMQFNVQANTNYPVVLETFDGSNNFEWTFDATGNLTLPGAITGLATAVTLNAGLTVGYSTAANVPTIADTGTGTGLTVDIIADSGNAGSITSVTLNQRGQGYAPGDQLTINQPSSTGNGELTVVAVETVNPSINYANGQPYGGSSGGNTDWANIGNINNQYGPSNIAVGANAGSNVQGANSIAVGYYAGNNTQHEAAIAIGQFAGQDTQGNSAVGLGKWAGQEGQHDYAVAIGVAAGAFIQGNSAIAIGDNSGHTGQNSLAISIGQQAGYNFQGANAIAIGAHAGDYKQGNNSIILNATGNIVDQQTDNTFTVAPVRNDTGNTVNALYYNTDTFELTYGPPGSNSIINGLQSLTIENDGSLLAANNGSATNYVINNNTPDVDLRNSSGTGSFTAGATNYTIRVAGTPNWVYDSSGALTLPLTSAIFEEPSSNWRYGLNIVGPTDNSAVRIYNYGSDGKGFGTSAVYINNTNVEIITNNQRSGGPGETWTFDNTGNFTAPGSISTVGNITSAGVTATVFAQLPVYTAANLILITGTVGQIASVSDSPTSGGRIAFWDTTSNRWSYISDNSAV